MIIKYICPSANVAIKKWPFIVSFPIKKSVMFHSYVGLPEGKPWFSHGFPMVVRCPMIFPASHRKSPFFTGKWSIRVHLKPPVSTQGTCAACRSAARSRTAGAGLCENWLLKALLHSPESQESQSPLVPLNRCTELIELAENHMIWYMIYV